MSRLISVIIPSYQHAKALGPCLRSIFAQTYPSVEIIVVDDGSTDETETVVRAYPNVRYIHQENEGANSARNHGARVATGDFLIFCDADVVMQETMLEELFKALETTPSADFAYSAFRFGFKLFRGVPFSAETLRTMNYIHTTALIRRSAFPGFDPAIKRLQDWDLWLTMVERGSSGVLVPKTLFEVQIDGPSRIGSSWLPKILYRLPWRRGWWMPRPIRRYYEAREVIVKKHRL
jgi:glycosyltransferase involved in cell wall biosynthesis